MRLDLFLVQVGYCDSRARAQAAIKAGRVRVQGEVCTKSSQKVLEPEEVVFEGPAFDYVSRGGVKLETALDAFGDNPEGQICLDLGASTGGFCDVLLRKGAAKVYAVDVGHGQLHPDIARDQRIVNLERTHAKDVSMTLIPEAIGLIVCDVSFISLKKALPSVLNLAAPLGRLVTLVKPQFEVGRAQIGKGGIVKDNPDNGLGVVKDIAHWLSDQGWVTDGHIESPIKGSDGNREFLLGATNQT